ncbi:hypothetical protein A6R68_10606, partial [Neotoma lepida]
SDWWTPLAAAAEVQSPSCSVKTQVRISRVFPPLFDRTLVEGSAAETAIKGGVMPLETPLGKVLQATVIAVGPGPKGWRDSTKYGGNKVVEDDKGYFSFRASSILGKRLIPLKR